VSATQPDPRTRATSRASGIPRRRTRHRGPPPAKALRRQVHHLVPIWRSVFTALGLKTGILDADIHGPSQPKLFVPAWQAPSGRPAHAGGRWSALVSS